MRKKPFRDSLTTVQYSIREFLKDRVYFFLPLNKKQKPKWGVGSLVILCFQGIQGAQHCLRNYRSQQHKLGLNYWVLPSGTQKLCSYTKYTTVTPSDKPVAKTSRIFAKVFLPFPILPHLHPSFSYFKLLRF